MLPKCSYFFAITLERLGIFQKNLVRLQYKPNRRGWEQKKKKKKRNVKWWPKKLPHNHLELLEYLDVGTQVTNLFIFNLLTFSKDINRWKKFGSLSSDSASTKKVWIFYCIFKIVWRTCRRCCIVRSVFLAQCLENICYPIYKKVDFFSLLIIKKILISRTDVKHRCNNSPL